MKPTPSVKRWLLIHDSPLSKIIEHLPDSIPWLKKGTSPKRISSILMNDFGSAFKVGMKNSLSQTGKSRSLWKLWHRQFQLYAMACSDLTKCQRPYVSKRAQWFVGIISGINKTEIRCIGSWDTVEQPKIEGGLGFGGLHAFKIGMSLYSLRPWKN